MPNNLGNKQTMANNIRYYMDQKGVTSVEMCRVLNVPASTFSYWLNARTYPRIDKIEKMANYFGISKADLVEERSEKPLVNNDEELTEMLEELRDRSDLRMLFSLTKNATKEDIQKTIQIIQMFRDGS